MSKSVWWTVWCCLALFVLAFGASGCQPSGTSGVRGGRGDEMPSLSAVELQDGEKLRVVATTSIVADVVQHVGGDLIEVKRLLPLGADPHTFAPAPQDVALIADAHVVFINGAGLEVFLDNLIKSADEGVTVVPVSYGLELLKLEGGQGGGGEDGHEEQNETDPHTWFDPNNVIVWTQNIEFALGKLDPNHAQAYAANARAYERELQELDTWIRQQVAQVPEQNRKLVTDHASFAYFCDQYGFEQVGAVIPGYSTLAEPSAQELAELEQAIRALGVQAVFVGNTVNPDLARQVAEDTGTKLVSLYTGSLSEPEGPAGDYISFMHYDVSAIAEALR